MRERFCLRYGEQKLTLELPKNLALLKTAAPADLPELPSERIVEAISKPIGTERISKIAQGREKVVVVVDDHTRPTPAHRIIPFVLRELTNTGIPDDQIEVVMAVGAHRMMSAEEIRRKLGGETVERIKITCHDAFRNMVFVGRSKAGVPIWVNRRVAESDVIISIGGIMPHATAGYGGGAKTLLPGVCSIETIKRNHEYQDWSCMGNVENNMRRDIEDVAQQVGLDFVVNAVMNADAKVCGVFAGHFVKAHREGVKLAERVYKVDIPEKADVVIASSFPQNVDLHMSVNTLIQAAQATKTGGTVIIVDPLYDGFGYHGMHLPFLEITNKVVDEICKRVNVFVCSEGISQDDFYRFYPREMKLTKGIQETIQEVADARGGGEAIIMPAAPFTIPTSHGKY